LFALVLNVHSHRPITFTFLAVFEFCYSPEKTAVIFRRRVASETASDVHCSPTQCPAITRRKSETAIPDFGSPGSDDTGLREYRARPSSLEQRGTEPNFR
jgi:hypothetical protein